LDAKIMGAEEEIPHTPPPNPIQIEPITPRTIRMARRNLSAVRRGEMDPIEALLKSEKALDGAYAEIQALKMEKEGREQADGLDRRAKGKRRKVTHPQGEFFDPKYQQDHAEELAARAGREKERKKANKQGAGAVSVPEPSNFVLGEAGPSQIDARNYS